MHPMNDAALGHDHELLRRIILAVGDHLLRRANGVGQFADFAETFGMDDDFRLRITRLRLKHGIAAELDVRVTISLPQRHRATCLFHHPLAEVFVRDEQQVFILRRSIHDFLRVAAGDNDIAKCFDCRAAIDVGNRPEIRIGLLQRLKFFRRTTFFERTTRVLVRQHDDLAGVQNLRRLRHEVYAAEDDDIRAGLLRLLREAERIADVIRHVLNLGDLVIVREDDGVQLFLERENFCGDWIKAFAAHRHTNFEAICWWQLDVGGVHHEQRLMPGAAAVNLWQITECDWKRRSALDNRE